MISGSVKGLIISAINNNRIFISGIDEEEDDENDEEVENSATIDLRRNAVFAYVHLMDKPILPDVLVKLICWVVGEYIDPEDGYYMEEVISKLYALLYRRYSGEFPVGKTAK